MKVRLNHNCGKPGCVGMPGDVIDVSKEDADYLLERGGAVIVEEVKVAKPVVVESATVEPSENMATRTTRPVGRPKKI